MQTSRSTSHITLDLPGLAAVLGRAATAALLVAPVLAQAPNGLRNSFRLVTSTHVPGSELFVDSGWQTAGPLTTPGSSSQSNPAGCASQGDCTATSDYGRLAAVGSGVANNCTSNGVFLYLDDGAGQPSVAQFWDTLTVMSSTLPAGSTVQVRYGLSLTGHSTAQPSPYFLTYGASFTNGLSGQLVQNDSPGAASGTFTATVGSQLWIHGELKAITRIQSLLNLAPPVLSGTYSVDLQADFWMHALTPGVTLQSTSGHDYSSVPVAYCTAGTSSHGCSASISANANPSLSLSNACNITVAAVDGQKSGLLFYGTDNTGFAPAPWAIGSSSVLCVKAPTQRTTIQNSGGTANACDGAFALDWNAFQSQNPLVLGNPWSAGAKVYVQAWFRDPPAPKATNLSNALEMTYVP